MSTILEQEIKGIKAEIQWQAKCQNDYLQDLSVYGPIASGYFFSSEFRITVEQAAERVKTAERMIPHYTDKLEELQTRLDLLLKMTEVQEVA